ncbi:MAG TPA: hypothetical protein VIJ47_14790, partial [Acidimicrobiales bacterium]
MTMPQSQGLPPPPVRSPTEVGRRNRRILMLTVPPALALLLAAIGLTAWAMASGNVVVDGDQWFEITVHNDTASTVRLMEPAPEQPPGLLAELAPGESTHLTFSNASSWTYTIEQTDGTLMGCLPFTFNLRTPPSDQRIAEVSSA